MVVSILKVGFSVWLTPDETKCNDPTSCLHCEDDRDDSINYLNVFNVATFWVSRWVLDAQKYDRGEDHQKDQLFKPLIQSPIEYANEVTESRPTNVGPFHEVVVGYGLSNI